MCAGEFEGLLYTILSEEPFNNQRFNMTEETDDYTIADFSQNFGMIFGWTMICLTCHENMRPKVLKDDSFISPLGKLHTIRKNETHLSWEKYSFGQ